MTADREAPTIVIGAGVAGLACARALADAGRRVIVLDRGTKAADGAPEEALSAAVIQQVWRVPARWLGELGARALVAT